MRNKHEEINDKRTQNTEILNIEDYLTWRADVPLAIDPFNEVDSLVLCELGYANLGKIVPADGAVTIAQVRDRYFQTHSREKLQRLNLFGARSALMLDAMADGARFRDMTVENHIDILDEDTPAQMEAMTFLPEDGTAYVCFCGTDDTIAGWKENFKFSSLKETKGQRLAVQYLTEAAALTHRPLRVGGHSKGGNFAVFAAAFADLGVQDRVTEVYAFDAPGFREEILTSESYRRIVPKVISIIPDTSIIGQLLSHAYQDIIVKSSESGLLQHDGFTWCVSRAGFIRAELSDTSCFIKQAQSDWLAKMDDDARDSFINTLFSPLEATESQSFHEMLSRGWQTVEKIAAAISSMPIEEQQMMRSAIQELMQSGEETALEMIQKKIDRLLTSGS